MTTKPCTPIRRRRCATIPQIGELYVSHDRRAALFEVTPADEHGRHADRRAHA